MFPADVLRQAQSVADAYTARTGVPVDAAELLTGRAAMLGIAPSGQVSAGGATRLLPAADGWWALTLSRPDDVAAIPALLETDTVDTDPWPAIAGWAKTVPAVHAVERARLLGLPAALPGETPPGPAVVRPLGARRAGPLAGALVVDLSSMWAGPLCGQLLVRAGATVVKVESVARPDGTRAGAREFFDWMNSGKLSYTVDFARHEELAALLGVADVVIEASRPQALTRRGLGAADIPARPGRIWLRITGHGTEGDRTNWVAFGDDAAVSGGLVGYRDGEPLFVGDAIADPLTGLQAAAEVAAARERGGGELIELSLASVAAGYRGAADGDATVTPVRPARTAPAPALGADIAAVHRLIAERSGASC